ncbi:MAG TPA: SPOR domain-containing protein [Telluria sp.]|nr:SPOR domain-containing protein [Telluria sp.]
MSLFSFLRKNKQESASDDSTFYSRAEEESNQIRGRGKRRQGNTNKRSEQADPVLPEKKRARRRLVGAIALVLAAVIGLPMILDSEPKPVADDIAIQIPSKDKTMPAASGRQPAEHPAAVEKVAASASLDPKEEEVIDPPSADAPSRDKSGVDEPAVKPGVTNMAALETSPPQAKDAPAKQAETPKVKPADKPHATPLPAAKADVKTESRPAEKLEKKPDEAARAQALLEGKPDPKAAEKKSGKFVIQVAALATKDKVDELQTRLKGAGIKSYTQKVATSSGDRIRIRVGPFASKEEADKMRAKMVKLGLNGTVVPA